MESLGGLNDVSEKDEMKEEKVVNLDEEKKKRKPFWYWTVKGRDYRLKLKASTISKLENKYRQNIMNLVEDISVKQEDGSSILYLCDKPTLGESQVVIKLNREGWGMSTDGGETWNVGALVDGTTITKILDAVGINAN